MDFIKVSTQGQVVDKTRLQKFCKRCLDVFNSSDPWWSQKITKPLHDVLFWCAHPSSIGVFYSNVYSVELTHKNYGENVILHVYFYFNGKLYIYHYNYSANSASVRTI